MRWDHLGYVEVFLCSRSKYLIVSNFPDFVVVFVCRPRSFYYSSQCASVLPAPKEVRRYLHKDALWQRPTRISGRTFANIRFLNHRDIECAYQHSISSQHAEQPTAPMHDFESLTFLSYSVCPKSVYSRVRDILFFMFGVFFFFSRPHTGLLKFWESEKQKNGKECPHRFMLKVQTKFSSAM